MKRRVLEVIGAPPHFMKIYQVYRLLAGYSGIEQVLAKVNLEMKELSNRISKGDFEALRFKYDLDFNLPSYLQRLGAVSEAVADVIDIESPDLVIVTGDVDATIATVVASLRKGIPIAHIESGLRNNDFHDWQEINRIVVDNCSTLLFTTDEFATANLLAEGVSEDRIFTVGNTNIDMLVEVIRRMDKSAAPFLNQLNLGKNTYGVMRIYRRENVNPHALSELFEAIAEISTRTRIVFLLGQVLVENIEKHDLQSALESMSNVLTVKPLRYADFVSLLMGARFVITDSGGIQDEASYLDIPCITLLKSTSRQATVELGTNTLVGNDLSKLKVEVRRILDGQGKKGTVPKSWDGKASERIVGVVGSFLRRHNCVM